MTREKTAFKHPNCGGVIEQCAQDGIIIFECDNCGERAVDIGSLILRSLVIIRKESKKPLKPDQGT